MSDQSRPVVVEMADVPKGIWYVLPPGSTGTFAERPEVAPHLAAGRVVEVISPRPNDDDVLAA